MAEFITETSNKTHHKVVQLRKAIRKVDTAKIAIFRKTDLTDAYREYNYAMYRAVEETGDHKIYIDFKYNQPKEKIIDLVEKICSIEDTKVEWNGSMGSSIVVTIKVE
ncbi:hypothetical protein [Aeromonas phage AS-sw]|uniref:Uncharacterized protein n=1 Tax=Aeromonas phage AS-sw TaxID=2026113 RepID=A0A291LFF3_9CAUD|nr:hypothetical protein HWB29_gp040 [Aeromonas phage AS-sw]ATI18090.1 hypothetical protein [Aeromonas phage AS-sw]